MSAEWCCATCGTLWNEAPVDDKLVSGCPECGTAPAEVFTTNDLSSVSIQQDGKTKSLLWRKRRGRRG